MMPGKTYPPIALAAILGVGAFSHVLAGNGVGTAAPQAAQLLKSYRIDGSMCLREPF